jgi:hypothetical protein
VLRLVHSSSFDFVLKSISRSAASENASVATWNKVQGCLFYRRYKRQEFGTRPMPLEIKTASSAALVVRQENGDNNRDMLATTAKL